MTSREHTSFNELYPQSPLDSHNVASRTFSPLYVIVISNPTPSPTSHEIQWISSLLSVLPNATVGIVTPPTICHSNLKLSLATLFPTATIFVFPILFSSPICMHDPYNNYQPIQFMEQYDPIIMTDPCSLFLSDPTPSVQSFYSNSTSHSLSSHSFLHRNSTEPIPHTFLLSRLKGLNDHIHPCSVLMIKSSFANSLFSAWADFWCLMNFELSLIYSTNNFLSQSCSDTIVGISLDLALNAIFPLSSYHPVSDPNDNLTTPFVNPLLGDQISTKYWLHLQNQPFSAPQSPIHAKLQNIHETDISPNKTPSLAGSSVQSSLLDHSNNYSEIDQNDASKSPPLSLGPQPIPFFERLISPDPQTHYPSSIGELVPILPILSLPITPSKIEPLASSLLLPHIEPIRVRIELPFIHQPVPPRPTSTTDPILASLSRSDRSTPNIHQSASEETMNTASVPPTPFILQPENKWTNCEEALVNPSISPSAPLSNGTSRILPNCHRRLSEPALTNGTEDSDRDVFRSLCPVKGQKTEEMEDEEWCESEDEGRGGRKRMRQMIRWRCEDEDSSDTEWNMPRHRRRNRGKRNAIGDDKACLLEPVLAPSSHIPQSTILPLEILPPLSPQIPHSPTPSPSRLPLRSTHHSILSPALPTSTESLWKEKLDFSSGWSKSDSSPMTCTSFLTSPDFALSSLTLPPALLRSSRHVPTHRTECVDIRSDTPVQMASWEEQG
ncbi:hypothetical protein BLNAU_4073 [Blattamonas nauphoetae]|uniref:Uncharacterized protein n=1 Tax=Blattamonas nauphoetae TaxID=2049346 RepID=A0ABQ9YB38_9EUKA|nr:hypothetical protein BLNAU_4073 [Blattamonas nauphoetae]